MNTNGAIMKEQQDQIELAPTVPKGGTGIYLKKEMKKLNYFCKLFFGPLKGHPRRKWQCKRCQSI
jgi:hypothetical protein